MQGWPLACWPFKGPKSLPWVGDGPAAGLSLCLPSCHGTQWSARSPWLVWGEAGGFDLGGMLSLNDIQSGPVQGGRVISLHPNESELGL